MKHKCNIGGYCCIETHCPASLALCFTLLCIVSCGSSEPPKGKKNGLSFLRCALPINTGEKSEVILEPLSIKQNGYDVTVNGIVRGQITFGLLAGINDISKKTMSNLSFFLNKFKDAHSHAVIVAGGIGGTKTKTSKILDKLSLVPVPILLIPGAEDNLDVFRYIVKEKQKKFPQFIDMTKIRRVHFANVTLVSIPGYSKPHYLYARHRGCSYTGKDIEKTMSLMKDDPINVVISPSPPKGNSVFSVDRGRGGTNMGDPCLSEHFKSNGLKFGLFGYVYECGGNATDEKGMIKREENIWHTSLFLQAGSAGAEPLWATDEGYLKGMAQIVEFSGNGARYKTIYAL